MKKMNLARNSKFQVFSSKFPNYITTNLLTVGNKLLDAERNLQKERDTKKKMREEHEDEVERLKKEQETAQKYWADRESKYLSEIDDLNQFKIGKSLVVILLGILSDQRKLKSG